MATRIKTVVYHFNPLDTLANNTLTNLPQLTIYIPDAVNNITFKSVFLKVSFDDIITATGGTITTKTLGLRLGSDPYITYTNNVTFSQTGENISLSIIQDFTDVFDRSWTGTTMVCDVQILLNQTTGTTLGFANVCGVLYITYEYEESIENSNALIKTVWIPVSNFTGSVPTSITTLGIMPNLDAYLPEVNKVYRNIALVFMANTHTASSTDTNLTFYISGFPYKTITHESALVTDRFIEYNFIIDPSYATREHLLQFSCDVANRYTNPIIYLVVTYEYDYSSSTRLINSLIIPFNDENIFNDNDSNNPSKIKIKYNIVERNAQFNNFGIYGFWASTNTGTVYFRIKGGAYNSVSTAGSGVVAGQKTFQYSTDNSNIANFDNGERYINLDVYTSDYGRNNAINGFIILVYTFDRDSYVINRNAFYLIVPLGTNTTIGKQQYIKPLCSIPETNYFLVNYGVCTYYLSTSSRITINININSNETSDSYSYYHNLTKYFIYGDYEIGFSNYYSNINLQNSIIQSFPNQPDKISPLVERKITILAAGGILGMVAIYNYYSYSYNLSGITYDNDGNKLGECDVYLYKKVGDKIEFVNKTVSDSSGNYSFTIYELNATYFVSAYKAGSNNLYDISDYIITQ